MSQERAVNVSLQHLNQFAEVIWHDFFVASLLK